MSAVRFCVGEPQSKLLRNDPSAKRSAVSMSAHLAIFFELVHESS